MLIVVLIVLQSAVVAVLYRLWLSERASKALSCSLTFMVAMWYLTPVQISLLSKLLMDAEPKFVAFDLFVEWATLESGVLLAVLLLLLYVPLRLDSLRKSQMGGIEMTTTQQAAVMSAGLILFFLLDLSSMTGSTYSEINAFQVTAAGQESFNNIGTASFVATLTSCFAYATVLVRRKDPRGAMILNCLVTLHAALFVKRAIETGSRIAGLLPLFLFALYMVGQGWSRRKMMASLFVTTTATILVGGVVADIVQRYRQNATVSASSVMGQTDAYLRSVGSTPDLLERYASLALTKFDSFSAAALLVSARGQATAGITPFVGSLLALVPRSLAPSKPVPGSADGTFLEHPSRIAARVMGYDYYIGNVGVSPAGVTVWQLGYLGLGLLIVSNWFYLCVVNVLFQSRSVVFKMIAVMLVSPPTLTMLFSSVDVTLMNLQRAGVLLLLFHFGLMVTGRYRIRSSLIKQSVILVGRRGPSIPEPLSKLQ